MIELRKENEMPHGSVLGGATGRSLCDELDLPPSISEDQAASDAAVFRESAFEWAIQNRRKFNREYSRNRRVAKREKKDRIAMIEALRAKDKTDTEIAEALGMSRAQIRDLCGKRSDPAKDLEQGREAELLYEKFGEWTKVGKELGIDRRRAKVLADRWVQHFQSERKAA